MSLNRGTVLGLISLVIDLLEGDVFVTISPPAFGALTETKHGSKQFQMGNVG